MNIKPLFPNIIIERLKPEEKSGGIFIPNTNTQESLRGVVLAVYEGCKLPIGAKLMYARLSGDPIKWDSKDCLIMEFNAENCLATYE